MIVKIEHIEELTEKNKVEILILFNKELRVGLNIPLIAHVSKGKREMKWARIIEIRNNFAGSDKVKYQNLVLVSA